MGHGIAQVAATAGYKVLLRDVDLDSLSRGIQAIERNLAKGKQLGKLTEADCDSTLQHIRGTTHLEEIANADLVIEAAPEQLELKQEILRELEAHSSKAFIFSSNTSSLSITEIAKASERPARVVGMHFFNPVHLMRLVEIVVGKATGDDTVEIVREVARRLRKEPIIVRDVPGFASSRLGVALGLEAMRMLEQGVASAKDIDTAVPSARIMSWARSLSTAKVIFKKKVAPKSVIKRDIRCVFNIIFLFLLRKGSTQNNADHNYDSNDNCNFCAS